MVETSARWQPRLAKARTDVIKHLSEVKCNSETWREQRQQKCSCSYYHKMAYLSRSAYNGRSGARMRLKLLPASIERIK